MHKYVTAVEGRKLLIYQFRSGLENNWCFVRTPKQYTSTGKPCPFIICNHGNGWIMDGTEAKAVWTARTQYGVDSQNDGAFLNNSDPMYVGYSNPTIETFLEAGYIVCGAQNGGDELYGNESCLQACIAFYFHMLHNFNVENSCYMLGNSNGFMTTLNASRLLGLSKVKAIIGQYPLCNLRHAYEVTHTKGIKLAYKIQSGDINEYLRKTADYDPFITDTEEIEGMRYKTKPYPPMKLYWSSTDTVLPMIEHAEKWIALLKRSNRSQITDVQVDEDGGDYEHGHWKHFDPQGYLQWFEQFR